MGRKNSLGNWSTYSKFSKPVNMPKIGSYVRKLMYDLEISVPALAKRLNISAARAYRMLRRNDWRVSEIMNMSMVLDDNLFIWYAGETGGVPESAPLQQRIAELEKENERLKLEAEIWKEAAGVKKG